MRLGEKQAKKKYLEREKKNQQSGGRAAMGPIKERLAIKDA